MKSILITGASSGIGKALALEASKRGYQVIACGRSEDKLNKLKLSDDNIQTLAFDVTDLHSCEQALAACQPDIAVLNAGTCEYVDIQDWQPEMFKRVFDANFFGVINCLGPLLKNLKPGSQIAIVDSLARLLPFTRSQAYGASKAAVHYLTKSLEVDLAGRHIRVQSVSPGFVETPLTDKNDFDMPMKISAEQAARQMLGGLEKGSRTIYFPLVFSLMIRLMGKLPDALRVAICKRMKTQ
ncbi:SDR family NAD(P)-dependent oxidoreductase [Lacimicrobium alkaliphilum]|uniref:Short-chain dehydrogenase n=1 Tax=Lacimicrobium alkaliphilum TaxID=1526571 RepID=A0A0U2JJA2_9ALTE|nr:SDR family NAD(P)-dependent oxidoreductase [Lacimicrobium alkaliphilum]ALS99158.1 short-chain dehydrogenase [Lacimicrobium alkaliphilum]